MEADGPWRSEGRAPTPEDARKRALTLYTAARSNLDMVYRSLLKEQKHCAYEQVTISEHVRGTWVVPEVLLGNRVVLYLHGGGLVWGSVESVGKIGMAPRLARSLKSRLLFVEYRLLPEVTVTDAIDDCLAAYKWLLEQGYGSAQVLVAGEASGGFLALWTMLKIRDGGLPPPAAVIALSPYTDFTLSGATARTQEYASRCLLSIGVSPSLKGEGFASKRGVIW